MFDKFLEYVHDDKMGVPCQSVDEFLERTAGKVFLNGLYTIFKKEDAEKWNRIIGEYFPDSKGNFSALGHDWMGKAFVIANGSNMIYMFDPEERKCYATDMDLAAFHDELADDTDGMLAAEYFRQWAAKNPHKTIRYGECVGLIVPLCLGGRDEIDNLEVIDMEVYWTMTLDIQCAAK